MEEKLCRTCGGKIYGFSPDGECVDCVMRPNWKKGKPKIEGDIIKVTFENREDETIDVSHLPKTNFEKMRDLEDQATKLLKDSTVVEPKILYTEGNVIMAPVIFRKRPCITCNKEFTPTGARSQWCSDECKSNYVPPSKFEKVEFVPGPPESVVDQVSIDPTTGILIGSAYELPLYKMTDNSLWLKLKG
jgi:hypothetical protein